MATNDKLFLLNTMTDKRTPFIDTLIELAEKDDKIVLIVPDVGFKHADRFKEKFPNRYFNLGVTEEATVMVAVGMAAEGFKPYVYSMINFVLFRPAEMVRNGVVCHKANVKLIGVSGSAAYKFLGFSHNLLHEDEDLDFCRNIGLPNVVPDYDEVAAVVRETYLSEKPFYIRL